VCWVNRRSFVVSGASAAVATASPRTRVMTVNERVRLRFVRVGNRGDQVPSARPAQQDYEVPSKAGNETGHQSTAAALIDSLALDSCSWLAWDGRQEKLTLSAEANRRLRYDYRKTSEFPSRT